MLDLASLLHWHEYTKLLIGLVAMMEPIGPVPIFLSLAPRSTLAEKRKMALVAIGASIVILLMFTFLGDEVLRNFGITIPAFRVAGGIVLLLTALDMLRAQPPSDADSAGEVHSRNLVNLAIVPLAMPILAGPAAITTVIVYSRIHESPQHDILVGLVAISASLIVLGILWVAPWVSRVFGQTGINAFNRIMGLIVAAIAVEFIMDGIALHFPELFGFEGHGHD